MTSSQEQLRLWLDNATDPTVQAELQQLAHAGSPEQLEDAFYGYLSFGTAGLRGIMGAGTHRMNVYTIARATQGLADYLNAHFDSPSVAIARDCRHNGQAFVETTARVLAANGIHAYIYPDIAPTPALSFATRDLLCSAGICITASHNAAPYNGYKVYGSDGCQITSEAADEISAAIQRVDVFTGPKYMAFQEAVEQGLASYIKDDTGDRYLNAIYDVCPRLQASEQAQPLHVVYTPLHGTGLKCAARMFERLHIDKVTYVEKQDVPDGDFPTCPSPNPESKEALTLGLETCKRVKADLLIATDPDADRCGIAVADGDSYTLLTGNEVGVLLLDFLAACAQREQGDLSHKVAVSTIVSTAMIDALAKHYGFSVKRVLTGFKYIGDVIADLERENRTSDFLLGFEESYGYLNGTYVRDKDAIDATMLICQMARHYKARGMSLAAAMNHLYETYGYYCNKTLSFNFPGVEGLHTMSALMNDLRDNPPATFGGLLVQRHVDYRNKIDGLPSANVIELQLADQAKVIFRPSGTEPKVKAYLFVQAPTKASALDKLATLQETVQRYVQPYFTD